MLEKAKQKIEKELFYFPNWIDENFIDPEKAKIHPYLKSNKFKILYSGNIGAKQDWDFFLKVIEKVKNNKELEFIIVGDGAKKEWLVEQIKKYENVKYFPPVPYKELPDLLCSADLHILFQKTDVIDTVMPSKLLGMMASAKPSLITGNKKSEVFKIINSSKAGVFFDNNVDLVSSFIKTLLNNEKRKQDYGKNAREYVIKYFSRKKVLNKFKEKINEILLKEK
jgi:colanic acid biosynthesis glycosyl transferase WcaI